VNNWPGLIAMAIVLVIAMILVAWAAFTLGDLPRPMPRRPLPYPRHQLHPRHAVEDQGATEFQERLVAGYVVTRRINQARKR